MSTKTIQLHLINHYKWRQTQTKNSVHMNQSSNCNGKFTSCIIFLFLFSHWWWDDERKQSYWLYQFLFSIYHDDDDKNCFKTIWVKKIVTSGWARTTLVEQDICHYQVDPHPSLNQLKLTSGDKQKQKTRFTWHKVAIVFYVIKKLSFFRQLR